MGQYITQTLEHKTLTLFRVMTRFSVLSELQRKSEDAAIRVKIVSKWNTVGGARPPHCQMILGDEKVIYRLTKNIIYLFRNFLNT